jgi:hypothetical protein
MWPHLQLDLLKLSEIAPNSKEVNYSKCVPIFLSSLKRLLNFLYEKKT